MLILENYEVSKRLKVSVNSKDIDIENIFMNESLFIDYNFYNLRRKYMIDQIYAIKESDNSLLQEANSNFLNGMIDILTKFINLIKDIFDKFILFMKNSLNLIQAFIRKEKVNINHIKNTDITFKGFKYTLEKKPVYDFNRLTQKQPFVLDKNFIESLNSDDIKNLERELKDDYYYDIIRGLTLNSYSTIQKFNFETEIKKAFRNGQEKEMELDFNEYTSVTELYADILNAKDIIEQAHKEKNDAINQFNNLILYFKNLVKCEVSANFNERKPDIRFYINNDTENEYKFASKNQVDNLRKYGIARSNEVKNISKIVTEVYTGKIQAIKDKYNQDCQLLRKLILNNF